MNDTEFQTLASLKGEELSAVCFVRDYIELQFDGPLLRCLANVNILVSGREVCITDFGFRDCLCKIIGSTVVEIKSDEVNEIHVEFGNNNSVRIRGQKPGEEFAQFVSFPNKRLQVWEVD